MRTRRKRHTGWHFEGRRDREQRVREKGFRTFTAVAAVSISEDLRAATNCSPAPFLCVGAGGFFCATEKTCSRGSLASGKKFNNSFGVYTT